MHIVLICLTEEEHIEMSDSTNNIPTDKQYPKLSKASSGYLEIEQFKNSDLHTYILAIVATTVLIISNPITVQ